MDVIERGIIEYLIVLRKEVKEYEGFEEYPELESMLEAKYNQFANMIKSDQFYELDINQYKRDAL